MTALKPSQFVDIELAADRIASGEPRPMDRLHVAADHAESRVAPTTGRQYRAAWAAYGDHGGPDVLPAAVHPDGRARTAQGLQAWISAMLQDGAAPSSVRVRVAAVLALVRAARELGLHAWAVAPRLPRADPGGGRPLVAWPRVAAMLAAAADAAHRPGAPAHVVRDATILHLAAHSALRRGEIASTRAEHVDLSADTPAVRVRRKGGAMVWHPISGATRELVGLLLAARGSAPGALLVGDRTRAGRPSQGINAASVGRIIRRRCWVAGLDLRAHDLRRCALIRCMRVTHDADLVRRLAGHRSLATTSRYLDRHDGAVALAVAAVAGERGQVELPDMPDRAAELDARPGAGDLVAADGAGDSAAAPPGAGPGE